MIVIINGPLGVGKTSLSWSLVSRFERAALLDADYVCAIHPFEIYSPERIEYQRQALHLLAGFHIQHGYRDLVINGVFEQPEELAGLRQALSDLDDEIYAFRLVCSPQAAEQRIRQRAAAAGIDPENLAWELQRFGQLLAIQNEAARRGDMGFVLDTSGLSAEQAAGAIWSNIREAVELLPYDPDWAARFESERLAIQAALGPLALEIEHIGSTAVPGLPAKPVIDLLVAVRCLGDAAACIPPLQALGYAFVDYPQNVDRRFFRKGLPRTHHLHIVAQGSASYCDHLDFRDALREDPRLRQEYLDLKTGLAQRYRNDRARYSDSKTVFVQRVLAERRSTAT
jgi:GrpB-like predicted nucleotidyltransferase (UPF0157 family)/predicted kinase